MFFRKLAILIAGIFVVGATGSSTWGRVYSPRILTSRTADCYSAKTFAIHPGWKDLAPEAQARAMFEYVTDPETGLYPLGATRHTNLDWFATRSKFLLSTATGIAMSLGQ